MLWYLARGRVRVREGLGLWLGTVNHNPSPNVRGGVVRGPVVGMVGRGVVVGRSGRVVSGVVDDDLVSDRVREGLGSGIGLGLG